MSEPTKIAGGKFALYQTPKGAMHLTLQMEGEEEPRHVEIPALMVKMMLRKAEKDAAKGVPSDIIEGGTFISGAAAGIEAVRE